MSNSSLASVKVPADEGNYTKGRESKISEITIHHMSGKLSAQRCGEIFQAVGRCGSSHYGIGYNGEIGLYVNECDTAWTNSNWESNCRAVTIETSNDINAYPWSVSDASLKSLIKLVADVAKRNNLGTLVKGKNLTWHRMYAATDCPGDYLLSKMDYIVSEANKLNSTTPKPTPKPTPTKEVLMNITGINKARTANAMILITDGRASTGYNAYGTDVMIDGNGKIVNVIIGKANSTIPSGCICVSGHGTADTFLRGLKKGQHIKIG